MNNTLGFPVDFGDYPGRDGEGVSLLRDVTFQILWRNLGVTVPTGKGIRKQILSNLNGNAKNGEIVAIMGPSGAGKSTFLNCLAGKVTNCSGEISFCSKEKKASFAYVPQTDDLCLSLTVEESLILSSQLKNYKKVRTNDEHVRLTWQFIKQFNLDKCATNLVSKCSGGEAKRLSIALEMISSPRFLLLDEPTSGLDSSTAYKCIETLKKTIMQAEDLKQPCVMTTIHQPSSNLFNLFDKVYILTGGSCLYYGPPQSLVAYFSAFGIQCPTYYNPADFALDIACDANSVEDLKTAFLNNSDTDRCPEVRLARIKRKRLRRATPFLQGYLLLLKKFFICWMREPHQVLFRLIEYLIYPTLLACLVDLKSIMKPTCMYLPHNATHVMPESLFESFSRQKAGVELLILLFFNLYFNYMGSLFPGILSFGSHISVFFKENLNNWYSTASFFFAFLQISLLFTAIFASINATAIYFLVSEEFGCKTWALYTLASVITTSLGDATALLISVINPRDQLSSVIVAGILALVSLIFSGALIKTHQLEYFGTLFSFTSSFRFVLSLISKIAYLDSSCDIGSRQFTFDQVLVSLEFYKHMHNKTFDLMGKMPCSVLNSLREDETWNRSNIFHYAEKLLDFEGNATQALDSFWTKSSNVITLEFDIDVTQDKYFGILSDFSTLIFMYLLYAICAYFLLRYRTSRH